MASVTGIANNALRYLGATRITDIADGTKNATVIADVYAETRDDLLRGHLWNFATERVKLARLATAPAFGFSYAYALPSGWLRTAGVHDNEAGIGTIVYREEGNAILTDSEDVYLSYVKRIEDPNLMTADFRRALAAALAEICAIPISDSGTLQDRMEKKAKSKLLQARSTDALAGTPGQRPHGSWITRRWR
jgi:hypothetical protein